MGRIPPHQTSPWHFPFPVSTWVSSETGDTVARCELSPVLAFRAFCGNLTSVRRSWDHPAFRSRYPLAALAGLSLTLAFPGFHMAGLAWVAPGLMTAVAVGKPGPEAFRLGYVAALAH
jgi:hypothetical protein